MAFHRTHQLRSSARAANKILMATLLTVSIFTFILDGLATLLITMATGAFHFEPIEEVAFKSWELGYLLISAYGLAAATLAFAAEYRRHDSST